MEGNKTQEKELKNVAGGCTTGENKIECKKCGEKYDIFWAKTKKSGGCNKRPFYQCPKCGEWNG